MLFNSFEFLVFLPVIFCLYWYSCRSRMQQNLLIVIASYVFYGWWDWRFLFLIAFTSLCSYASGIVIAKYDGERIIQKAISAANIILNLLILGVVKYCDLLDHMNSSVNGIIKEYDVEYKDYRADKRITNIPNFFKDADHLSDEGANAFTKILKEDFRL